MTMSVSMDALAGAVGGKAVQALQDVLGTSWGALSASEREACLHLLTTMVRIRFKEVMGEDVSSTLEILDAAFQQWKVVGKQVVVDAVRQVAKEGFGLAGAFAGSALATFVKGM